MPQKPQSSRHLFFFRLIVTATWCMVVFFSTALMHNLDAAMLSRKLITVFYLPHHNTCAYGKIGDGNVVGYIYFIILVSALTIRLLESKIFKFRCSMGFLPVLQLTTCTTLCILLALQTTNQVRHLAWEYKKYAARPIDKRYGGILKTIYDYAASCRRDRPGRHSAQFISDLDVSRDPGMFIHRALAYFLYPIDIRDIRQEPKDGLVVFMKDNPRQSVPDDFEIVGAVTGISLFAVKQEKNE